MIKEHVHTAARKKAKATERFHLPWANSQNIFGYHYPKNKPTFCSKAY